MITPTSSATLRLAGNELRRVTAGKLPKLAVLALILVPLLYGALYLYANDDPYSRLDRIPAALVVSDTGADQDGEHRNAGARIADKLESADTFDWHRVDAEAESGVREGKYTFALDVPPGFSAALLSSAEFQPRQGMVRLITNDANNYLAGTIADKLGAQLRETVAGEVGAEAADKFLSGFSSIHRKVSEASDGAGKLADGTSKLENGTGSAVDGAAELAGGLHTLRDRTAGLPAQSRRLADGAARVAAGNQQVAQAGQTVATTTQDLMSKVDGMNERIAQRLRAADVPEEQVQQVLAELAQLRAPLDETNGKVQETAGQLHTLADGAKRVADGANKLAASAPELSRGIGEAKDGADQLASGTRQLDSAAHKLDGGTTKLRDGLESGLKQIPNPDKETRKDTASTLGDPVGVNTVGQASAGSYGAGLAPFFLGLATWIGAFVLFLLLRPLSARALAAGQPAPRVALGGWLPAALLGIAQVVVMFGAVTLLVGIRPANPVAALGFLALVSLTFTAIVHALGAAFGAVGKFIALLILILQLVSAGGTFPWQTLPGVLQPMHAILPMGYVVDGLRHTMYAGAGLDIGSDVGVLLAYLLAAITLSTVAAYRQRMWTASRLKPELAL